MNILVHEGRLKMHTMRMLLIGIIMLVLVGCHNDTSETTQATPFPQTTQDAQLATLIPIQNWNSGLRLRLAPNQDEDVHVGDVIDVIVENHSGEQILFAYDWG